MFRSVAVPLDGSSFSERSLSLAEALGRASPDTRLHLGHVHVPYSLAELISDTRYPRGSGDLDEYDRSHRQEERRYLTRLVERLRDAGVAADAELLDGEVVEAIDRWAEASGADLLVMASHGRAGLQRLRLGSVAARLIARRPGPVLLLHPAEDGHSIPRLKQALVALDGSSFAEAILEPLQKLAETAGIDRLTLVSVLASDSGSPKAGWTPRTVRKSRALEYLDGVRSRLEDPSRTVETRVVDGDAPAEAILRLGKQLDADLIALATHGMTGLRPTVFGSVAARILHEWDRPLLLRRPEPPRAA